jgi:hypothetical protein
MLLVLLAAVALRLFSLTTIPPGLTHDEADHGITAVSILEGTRAIYFTIGHGREPFYDYVTAVLMAGIGSSYLAGRLVAVFSSLLMIAGMAAWVRRAFDWQTAVLTAAALAVTFWPIMAARQSLRSITLPMLFIFAVYFFWKGLASGKWQVASGQVGKWQVASGKWQVASGKYASGKYASGKWQVASKNALRTTHYALRTTDYRLPITDYVLAGLFLGLTFYTYIPARILWLVFPLVLVYLELVQRPLFHKAWRGVLLMLLIAGLVGSPLFYYLYTHPEAEIRIRELSGPLTAAMNGNYSELWQNVAGGLGIIAWRGDDFWRYNLPGRPLLGPIMSILFAVGLVLAGWWVVRPLLKRPDNDLRGTAAFLALSWLLIGLAPTLVTGPHLSSTQAMGMQPVLYLFPAMALREIGKNLDAAERGWTRIVWGLMIAALFLGTAVFTIRDYFVTWGNAPEVRVQYEAALTAVMEFLNEQEVSDVAVSTITPGPYHTPALAAMVLTNDKVKVRWFDGRTSLLIPQAEKGSVILSGFAALPEALLGYWDIEDEGQIIPQPASDLDRPLTVYEVNAADWLAEHQADFTDVGVVQFGETAEFLGYDLTQTSGTIQLITLWRLGQPTPGLRLFSHVSGVDGVPITQTDLLSAPGEFWVAGDLLLQLHEIPLPTDMLPGQYPLTIGLYTCQDAACQQVQRLPVLVDGRPANDQLHLQDLRITP